jgi:hypothetical protein
MKRALAFGWILLATTATCLAERRIEIDLTNQRVYLLDAGRVLLGSPICSGRPGHETPTGNFRVTSKDIDHSSSTYGFIGDPMTKQIVIPDADTDMRVPPGLEFVNAPMRYYIQFLPAIGMHAGYLPGKPDSHGCIRLPEEYASALFNAVGVGTPVRVYGRAQRGRQYWASPRGRSRGSDRLVAFEQRRGGDGRDFQRRARSAAFDQFEAEWDAKEAALDRQIEALERKLDRANRIQRYRIEAEIDRLEQFKDELDFRREAAEDSLRRRWGD